MRNIKLKNCPPPSAISGPFCKEERFRTLIDGARSEKHFKDIISGVVHHISKKFPKYAQKVKRAERTKNIFSRPWLRLNIVFLT